MGRPRLAIVLAAIGFGVVVLVDLPTPIRAVLVVGIVIAWAWLLDTFDGAQPPGAGPTKES